MKLKLGAYMDEYKANGYWDYQTTLYVPDEIVEKIGTQNYAEGSGDAYFNNVDTISLEFDVNLNGIKDPEGNTYPNYLHVSSVYDFGSWMETGPAYAVTPTAEDGVVHIYMEWDKANLDIVANIVGREVAGACVVKFLTNHAISEKTPIEKGLTAEIKNVVWKLNKPASQLVQTLHKNNEVLYYVTENFGIAPGTKISGKVEIDGGKNQDHLIPLRTRMTYLNSGRFETTFKGDKNVSFYIDYVTEYKDGKPVIATYPVALNVKENADGSYTGTVDIPTLVKDINKNVPGGIQALYSFGLDASSAKNGVELVKFEYITTEKDSEEYVNSISSFRVNNAEPVTAYYYPRFNDWTTNTCYITWGHVDYLINETNYSSLTTYGLNLHFLEATGAPSKVGNVLAQDIKDGKLKVSANLVLTRYPDENSVESIDTEFDPVDVKIDENGEGTIEFKFSDYDIPDDFMTKEGLDYIAIRLDITYTGDANLMILQNEYVIK